MNKMIKKLPVFEMNIDDDDTDDTGISSISLVERPAIDVDFVKFSEEQPAPMKFAIQSTEMKIVSGPIMIPGILIYRNDERGQYYITASKDNIYKVVQKYARTQRPTNVNLEHGQDGLAPGCYLFESFVIDKERGISCPSGFDLPDGTWFGSMKIEDDSIWESVVEGTFKGFSLEGFFNLTPKVALSKNDETEDLQLWLTVKKLIDSLDES